MMNMGSIIKAHNKKILKTYKSQPNEIKLCNCRDKDNCPLNGNCTIKNVIYEAQVTTDKTTMKYIGSTANTFKQRFYGHTASFKNETKRLSTELSKHIWKLKDEKKDFNIKWKILRKINQSSNTINQICQTCNLEKMEIALSRKRDILNKRSELITRCVHNRKLYF